MAFSRPWVPFREMEEFGTPSIMCQSTARKVVSCTAEDDLDSAAQLMQQNRTRRLPVIGSDGTLVVLLSLDDLACEAVRTLRGGVNDKLRNLVLEVHLAIHHGRVRLHPAA